MIESLFRNVICNPVFLSEFRLRRALRGEINRLNLKNKTVLDLGCGDKQYQPFFLEADYFAIDVESSGRPAKMKCPDLYFDGVDIPFASNFFDVILCTQVLEHAENPMALMLEAKRVCKKDGVIVLSVPFVYPEHEVPFDFRRYSAFGVHQLADQLNFTVINLVKDSKAIEVITVLFNLFFIHSLLPNIKWIKPFTSAFLCFPAQVFAFLFSLLLRADQELYFNIVVTLKKTCRAK